MLAAFLDWTLALLQTAFLWGPAFYLSALSFGKSRAGPSDRIIATSLWAIALVYANYLFALLIGVYTWPVSFALHALIVALCFAVLRFARGPGDRSSAPVSPPNYTPPPIGEAFARIAEEGPLVRSILRLSLLAVAAVTLTGAILNLRTPPGGWDALTYHLDFPMQWTLAGEIFPALTAYGDYSPTYYPALVEAFAGWYLLPGRGAAVADLVQVCFAPLLYCAIRDIAYFYLSAPGTPDAANENAGPGRGRGEITGAVSPAAEAAPLLILSLPYLQSSLLVADNDFALCALLAAAWRGALFRGLLSFSTAAPAALAVTVKYTGLVFATALGAALLLAAILSPQRSTGIFARENENEKQSRPRDAFRYFAYSAGFAALIAMGASQYILNWQATGNPVYPATLEAFGLRVFEGYYPREFFEQHPFHEFRWRAFFTEPGLSPPLLFACGAICAGAFASLAGGRPRGRLAIAGLIGVPLILFLAFYFLIPLRQFRLALPVIACSGPALVLFERYAAEFPRADLRARFRTGFVLLLYGAILAQCAIVVLRFTEAYGQAQPFAVHAALNEISRATIARVPLDSPAEVAGFAFFTTAVAILIALARRALRVTAGRFALLAGVLILPILPLYEQTRAPYGGPGLAAAYRAVEGMRGNIGVVGTNALLPFRGRRPDAANANGRVHLLLNRPGGDRPLHEREESLRYDPENETWVAIGTLAYRDLFEANLKRRDIQTMVIATTIGTRGKWPAEYEWLRDAPQAWDCECEFSNAVSGDPEARIAICTRQSSR